MGRPLKAVVLGGTGAVGRELVAQLAASPRWDPVVCVGRRAVELPPGAPGAERVQQVVVDMDRLDSEAGPAFVGADSCFCALGTTREAAGGAEAFRRVDRDYVAAAARAARAAGVPHFSLVSASGASARVPALDWKPFHGLLYMRTKGEAEAAVRGAGFPAATVLRPGLLERGDLARPAERRFAALVNSVPAAQVAAVMVAEAERAAAAADAGRDPAGERMLTMKEIQEYEVGGAQGPGGAAS